MADYPPIKMSAAEGQDRLLAVVQVFRHGQKTPIAISYPNDPYKDHSFWPVEKGELTNEGKRQMYQLGQQTRQRYQNLLPAIYSKKDFCIYTTESERCITSAQLYNAGLYPPTDKEVWSDDLRWNPIPTFLADAPVLRVAPIEYCPSFAKDFKVYSDELLEKARKDPLTDYIVEHSGIELDDFSQLHFIYEALLTQDSLGLKLPEWTKKVYPKMNHYMEYKEVLVKTDKMKRLFVGPLLYEIVQNFERMSRNSPGPKLTAYSAHDSNLIGILCTLGAFDRVIPPHGSSIFFELWNKKGENYVNVYYSSGNIIPITLTGGEFDCKLNEFKDILDRYLISKENFFSECSLGL